MLSGIRHGVAGRDLGAVGRHVDELVAVGHVAGGIDAGARGLHVSPHDDPAAAVSLHARLLEAEIFGIGLPTGGDDDLLRRDVLLGPLLRDPQCDASFRFADAVILQAGQEGDALGLEGFRQSVGDFQLGARQQAGARHEGHLDPHPCRHLRQFCADIASSDEDQAFGQGLQLQKRLAVEWFDILDPADRRDERPAARSNQRLGRGDCAISDLNTALDQRRGAFLDVIDPLIVGQQVGVFLLAQSRDKIVLAGDEAGPVVNLRRA